MLIVNFAGRCLTPALVACCVTTAALGQSSAMWRAFHDGQFGAIQNVPVFYAGVNVEKALGRLRDVCKIAGAQHDGAYSNQFMSLYITPQPVGKGGMTIPHQNQASVPLTAKLVELQAKYGDLDQDVSRHIRDCGSPAFAKIISNWRIYRTSPELGQLGTGQFVSQCAQGSRYRESLCACIDTKLHIVASPAQRAELRTNYRESVEKLVADPVYKELVERVCARLKEATPPNIVAGQLTNQEIIGFRDLPDDPPTRSRPPEMPAISEQLAKLHASNPKILRCTYFHDGREREHLFWYQDVPITQQQLIRISKRHPLVFFGDRGYRECPTNYRDVVSHRLYASASWNRLGGDDRW